MGERCHTTNILLLLTFPFICFELLFLTFLGFHSICSSNCLSLRQKINQNYPFFFPKHRPYDFFGRNWGFELYGRRGTSVLPLRSLSFCLRGIMSHPCFITSTMELKKKFFLPQKGTLWQRTFRTWQDFLLTYCTRTNTTRQVLVMTRIGGTCWIQETLYYHLVLPIFEKIMHTVWLPTSTITLWICLVL